MTSAENSVSEPPNLNKFSGGIYPQTPLKGSCLRHSALGNRGQNRSDLGEVGGDQFQKAIAQYFNYFYSCFCFFLCVCCVELTEQVLVCLE